MKGTVKMREEDLIRIRWHVDRTVDPPLYMLICLHPDHPDLQVSVSSAEVTERVAKARLMQEMRFDALIEKINRPPKENDP